MSYQQHLEAFSKRDGLLVIFFMALSLWLYASRVDVWIYRESLSYFNAPWQQDVFGYLSRAGQAWFQILLCAVVGVV